MRIRKILALVLALVMVAAMTVSAFADATIGDDGEVGAFTGKDNPVSQDKVLTIKKALRAYNVSEGTVKAPTITYTYKIDPATVSDQTVEDSADKHTSNSSVTKDVKAGIGGATISETVSWTPAGNPLNASPNGTDNTQDITIDFSAVKFTGAGVYRYVITEDLASGFSYPTSGVTETTEEDTKHTRYIDVYVRPVEDGFGDGTGADDWDIYGYTCFMNNASIDPDNKTSVAVKTTGFVSVSPSTDSTSDEPTYLADSYYTFNVEVEKTVNGDAYAANNNKFPFTITLENEAITKNVDVDASVAAGEAEVTDPAAGTFNFTVEAEIQSGAKVKIVGIPCGTTVNVNETNNVTGATYNAEGTVSPAGTNAEVKSIADGENSNTASFSTDADAADNNEYIVAFTNTLVNISPTGIIVRYAPYLLMLCGGILILVLGWKLVNRSKKNEEA